MRSKQCACIIGLESQPAISSRSRELRVATGVYESQQGFTSRNRWSRLVMVRLRVAT
ncbi:hypothetical protein Hanom_Chr07g00651211 [Helianthus anomalus]